MFQGFKPTSEKRFKLILVLLFISKRFTFNMGLIISLNLEKKREKTK